MTEHVAVDATRGGQNGFYLLGVAIGIEDQESFDEFYFEKIREFTDHYEISTDFSVLKTRHITSALPSFKIGSGLARLAEELVANPSIARITVSVGWYEGEATLHSGNSMNGIKFASNFLHQYFPVVTLWRHYEENGRFVPDKALVDNVTGRITDCWGTVGNRFDLHVAPNADMIYPSVSTADIVASALRSTFPPEIRHNDRKAVAFNWLKEKTADGNDEPHIKTESVNENAEEMIVPRHPHNIHSELHYPHPIVFIHDRTLNDTEGKVLESTKFHQEAARYAYENDGCVVKLDVNEWPFVVQSGDVIVHTAEHPDEKVRNLARLSPDKDVDICDVEEFLSDYSGE